MLINRGRYIRSKNAMDVCIRVVSVFDYGHGLEIKGEWVNMGFVESWELNISIRLNFSKDRHHKSAAKKVFLGDWEILDESPDNLPKCLRHGNWISL